MSEYAEVTIGKEKSFWGNLPDAGEYLDENLPTMDKTLDSYFNKNMEAIIKEWGLIAENDLLDLERRLNRVSGQVNQLDTHKTIINERVAKLDALISRLERR
jgi:hypothetical protein